jgi:Beta-lactamase
VFTGGGYGAMMTEPATRDITFRDLLTHTSGLTYGFMQAMPVDVINRAQKLDLPGSTEPLGDIIARLAKVPLIAQPGLEWNYSNLERRARPTGCRHRGPAFRPIPARACSSAARHGRYRFPYPVRQGKSLCG